MLPPKGAPRNVSGLVSPILASRLTSGAHPEITGRKSGAPGLRIRENRGHPRSGRPLIIEPAQRIGGAYCRPPLFHSAFTPRLIFRREPWPTFFSNTSP